MDVSEIDAESRFEVMFFHDALQIVGGAPRPEPGGCTRLGLVDGSSRDASLSFYCFKSDLCFWIEPVLYSLCSTSAKVHRRSFLLLGDT